MSTYAPPTSSPTMPRPELIRTARLTGVFYLGLAVTGMLGFLLVRNQLFVADDPEATLGNLADQVWLARAGIGLELGIVLTQVLAALWFFKLFRGVDTFAAGLIAVFGTINAVVILASAALLGTAYDVARDAALAPGGDDAATVQLLYTTTEDLWGVGAMFFGLWLIPMGWLVIRSGWLPRVLGWILVGGGIGYLLSSFTTYLFPDAPLLTDVLAFPATIGEFWIIGYLLYIGVRTDSRDEEAPVTR